ncbi:unnamed protein product [Penicillium nalgiovense]|nr:unnamed protein product [Penicillium nalgiovense]
MSIASGFVTRVYCVKKLSCASQGGFFEASADCDELECDVAWLVTALQRVENTLISATRVECHANKYLVCSSSPIQIRLHALCPFHMNTIDDESQKVRIAHLGLFLPIDSAYRVIVRFVYMIQLLNSDQPIPLPESYLWLSMQPSKSSSGVGC